MRTRSNTHEFIQKAKSIHGNKYDYSKVEYKKSNVRVCIVCPKHGEFWQIPNNHLRGATCKKCSLEEQSKRQFKGTKTFVEQAKSIHGNKYDYSKVEYKGTHTKVRIVCPKHGEFWQAPVHHINGHGCNKCAKETVGESMSLTNIEFIQKAKSIHGNKYDYSKVEYKNKHTNINIVCPKHGLFSQKPGYHLCGCGCPMCKSSKGEMEIERLLNEHDIYHKRQHRFENCKNELQLPFDFFLPLLNICIEYDGVQHFKPVEYFGGEKKFETVKINDKIKNEFCRKNNIRLIRVKYDENITERLMMENVL